MPRLPVDGKKVIEHRITFGTKEREILESFAFSQGFKNVATPTVDLLKDVSGLIAFAYIANRTFGLNLDFGGITDLDELIQLLDSQKWKSVLQELEPAAVRDERATSVGGGILNLLDQITFVLSGGILDRLNIEAARQRRENENA